MMEVPQSARLPALISNTRTLEAVDFGFLEAGFAAASFSASPLVAGSSSAARFCGERSRSTINGQGLKWIEAVNQRVFTIPMSYAHTLEAGAFLGAALVLTSGAGFAGSEATRDERRGSAAEASVSFFLAGIVAM
jgi:hypothetical protein